MSTLCSSPPVLFPRISTAYIEGAARSIRHRQQECHKLQCGLVEAKSLITNALQDDNGYSETEALFEYGLTLMELRQTYESINLKAENAAARAIDEGRGNPQRVNSVGIVYIIPARSKSSLHCVLSPLIAATAAGNCVIVEMPNTTRNMTSILRTLLLKALSKDTFAISNTPPPASFLKHCVVVQQNDSESETLEKLNSAKRLIISPSPATSFFFVDRSADLTLAARKVLEARFAFCGSSPYAPNIVFVHEAIQKDFCVYLKQVAGALPAFYSAEDGSMSVEKKIRRANKGPGPKEKDSLHEVLLEGTQGRIILVQERSAPAVVQKLVSGSGSHVDTLILASTKSLDDAISAAERLIGDPFQTASGAFIFASSSEANYLANSLNADLTCVNCFPMELLVGPRLPKPIKINIQETSLLRHRYTRGLFEEERAVLLGQSPVPPLLGEDDIDVGNTKDTAWRINLWVAFMQLPLKPTGQGSGRRMDFFVSGLLVTVCTLVIPMLVFLSLLGRFIIGKVGGGWGAMRL